MVLDVAEKLRGESVDYAGTGALGDEICSLVGGEVVGRASPGRPGGGRGIFPHCINFAHGELVGTGGPQVPVEGQPLPFRSLVEPVQ